MASQISQQYAFRAQKSLGLVGGTPNYEANQAFEQPEATARTYNYSPDGRLFAYALPTGVRIFYAESAEFLRELPIPNVVEFKFSPRGTYMSTWERPVKLEDGAQNKNLRVFSVSTGEELASFTQKSLDGWDLQYTMSESHAVRLVGHDVQVFHPAEWSKGVVDKLRVEGATNVSLSFGLNPSLAVFVAEKNGQPANIRIYSLLSLSSPPTCQKSAFRAEHAQFKWNDLGTQVLVLIRTDVDATNKSYYGETRLYLLSAAGNFDCLVSLPKEGPIHDFAWSPNSKEFSVVCGYTPTKTVIFDQRVKILHDFGTAPHNFIAYNPQGRLLALAGFGNMSGKLDIYDRRKLEKVTTIDAPNTTTCEWSPDGRFLLTATLSPRLRVDNGIKIWHCTGPLLHVHLVEELYQASWRPTPIDSVAPFPQVIPTAPAPSASVADNSAIVKPAASKPAGAYRPPGARGLATPSIFLREDEGGAVHSPSNGAATPPRQYNRSPAPGPNGNGNGHHPNGYRADRGRRHVPGAASPSPVRHAEGEKRGKKRKGKDDKKKAGSGAATPVVVEDGVAPPAALDLSGLQTLPAGENSEVPPTPGADGALDPVAKKLRNLNKKLKAIEELKEKAKRGERLEATQVKKMEGEAEIRQELASLAASP
ncbi:translation initiation factor eIF-2A [Rickenella mellea]|uniref:Eukaryotic translation initiation factor 2A n=1 Tax=Rickenella mellea TaxID=50990 RepID=A0A4Y7PTZ5_9AGAM|nr:translation initiation factor eIF-2A [Rickenella mellea]